MLPRHHVCGGACLFDSLVKHRKLPAQYCSQYSSVGLPEASDGLGVLPPFCPPGKRFLWIPPTTPPPEMVALMSPASSSSPRMAIIRCLGVMRFKFISWQALPANSRTSAARYSMTAAEKTPAVPPTRILAVAYCLRWRWMRPTGKRTPARRERPKDLPEVFPHFGFFLPFLSFSLSLSLSLPLPALSLSLSFTAFALVGSSIMATLPPPTIFLEPLSKSEIPLLPLPTGILPPVVFLEPFLYSSSMVPAVVRP
mmetsp:Transcript_36118/g.58303  ORF Transcript_36118/g.58303 Transcript_36118/m.58303 type:complete len:254 (+) Transcript_36118:12-773(+)